MAERCMLIHVLVIVYLSQQINAAGHKPATSFMITSLEGGDIGIGPALAWNDTVPITGLVNLTLSNLFSISYDPTEQKIYGLVNTTDSDLLVRCGLDGSEEETIETSVGGGRNFQYVTVLDEARQMILVADGFSYLLSLDGVQVGNSRQLGSGSIENILDIAYNHDTNTLFWIDIDGIYKNVLSGMPMGELIFETVTNASLVAIDPEEDRVYWSGEGHINSSDASGNDVTTLNYDADVNLRQLIVYEKQLIAVAEDSVLTFDLPLGPAPKRLPVARGIHHVSFFELPGVNDIKVIQTRSYHGGFLATVAIRIEPEMQMMTGWELDIHFPRNVFSLQVMGCNAVVEKKTPSFPDGPRRRKASTYTLRENSGEFEVPRVGEKLIIKVKGTAYSKARRFERGVTADFYPIYPFSNE